MLGRDFNLVLVIGFSRVENFQTRTRPWCCLQHSFPLNLAKCLRAGKLAKRIQHTAQQMTGDWRRCFIVPLVMLPRSRRSAEVTGHFNPLKLDNFSCAISNLQKRPLKCQTRDRVFSAGASVLYTARNTSRRRSPGQDPGHTSSHMPQQLGPVLSVGARLVNITT